MMKKRLLSLFLALAMVLTMMPGDLLAKAATVPYLGCNQPGDQDVREKFDTCKYADTDIGFFFVDSTGPAQSLALSDLSFSQNYTDIIELTPYGNNGYMRIKTKEWGTVTVSYLASDGQTYTMDIISHIHAPGYYSANSATQTNWLREFTVTKTDKSEVIYFIANPNNASETLSGWTPTFDLASIADVELSSDKKCYTVKFKALPEDGKTYGFEVIDSGTQQSVANDYITLYDGINNGSGNTGVGGGGSTVSDYDQITGDVYSITYDSNTGMFTIDGLTQEFDTVHGTGVNLAFYSGTGYFINDVWISHYQYVRDTNNAVTGITFNVADLSNIGAAISGNAYQLALAQFIQSTPVKEIRNKLTQSTPIQFDIPAGNSGGNTGGTIQEVNVQLETDCGQITIVNGNDNFTQNNFDTGVKVGESLSQRGFTFADPVCEAGKRGFKYWNLIANTESGSVDLQQKMSTQQVLDYVVTSDYETIVFVAQWDKDKSEFGSQVSLDAYGGSFVVNHNVNNTDNNDDKETIDHYSVFIWDGSSVNTQEPSVGIVSDPAMDGHTFEGWLEFAEDGSYSIDSDGKYVVYTTAQVLAKTVSTDNLRYVAKWAEISIDDYTNSGGGSNGDPNQDVYYEGMNYYEGHAYVPAGHDLKIKIINNLVPSMTNITWRVGIGLGDANPTLFTEGKEYTVDANDSAKITLHGVALQETLAALNTDAFTVEVSSAEGFTYEHTVFLKDENDLGGGEGPGEGPSVSGDDITIEANGHTDYVFDHGTIQDVIIGVNARSQSGAELTYQWYCNGQKIEGATKAEYRIDGATADAVYNCEVSNGIETIDSMDFNIVFTVNVQFQGNGGEFEFAVGDNREVVGDTGFGKRIGKTMLEEGFNVTDPVWPDGSRNFVGWHMIGVMDSQGGNLIAENVTTEYALNYVITDKYPTIVFEAQWDGEDQEQGGEEGPSVSGEDITIQPNGQTMFEFELGSSQSVKIAVTANSESEKALTYQWYCNGTKIEGATTAEYQVVDLTSDAVYYCEVSNGEETVQSMDFMFVFIVNVQFVAGDVVFDFSMGDDTMTVTNAGFGVRVGKTSLEEGFSVTDPVWPGGSRNFLGWHMIGMEENGGTLVAEYVSTADALRYMITAKYSAVIFEAQWEGDDDDYYTSVWLDLYGGLAKFDWGDWIEETDNWGNRFHKTQDIVGTTLYSQLGRYIIGDPYRAGYTFEGWLMKDDEWNLLSKDLYTTEQILGIDPLTDGSYLTIQNYNIIYQVKWKEIPMDEYLKNIQVDDLPVIDPDQPVEEVTVGVNTESAMESLDATANDIVDKIEDGKANILNGVVPEEVIDVIQDAVKNKKLLAVVTSISADLLSPDEPNTEEVKKDMDVIENAAGNAMIAQYLDLKVNIKATSKDDNGRVETKEGNISELDEPIQFEVAIPEGLRDAMESNIPEGHSLVVFVLYRHGNKVYRIDDVSLNDSEDTMTISFLAHQFSTYALAYEYKENSAQGGAPTPQPTPQQPSKPQNSQKPAQSAGNAPTGDNAPVMLYTVLALVSMMALAVVETKRRVLRR